MSELELAAKTDEDLVYEWRLEELKRAGYCEEQAEALARRRDVDLHRAVGLLREGCSRVNALRILL